MLIMRAEEHLGRALPLMDEAMETLKGLLTATGAIFLTLIESLDLMGFEAPLNSGGPASEFAKASAPTTIRTAKATTT